MLSDEQWMRHALRLAQRAEADGEVPVGALLVAGDECVGEGWNCPIACHDPSAHAEIVALREAGARLGNYRMTGTTLYVTLEPCVMCVGAIANARVRRIVFGAYDPKRGAICSALPLVDARFLNHRAEWQGGVLDEACATLLLDFFQKRRKKI